MKNGRFKIAQSFSSLQSAHR